MVSLMFSGSSCIFIIASVPETMFVATQTTGLTVTINLTCCKNNDHVQWRWELTIWAFENECIKIILLLFWILIFVAHFFNVSLFTPINFKDFRNPISCINSVLVLRKHTYFYDCLRHKGDCTLFVNLSSMINRESTFYFRFK